MTVAALAAMLVARCLPSSADSALELQTSHMNRREQAEQRMSTAACERGTISDAYQVVAQLWICTLTLLELDMLSVADRQQSASLHTAEQQQRVLAYFMSHVMHTTHVHVAAWY